MTDSQNSISNSSRVRYLTIATTAFVTTISILFLYYLRRSRPEDPSTRKLTSILMGATLISGVLYSTVKLYLVSLHDKTADTVHSDWLARVTGMDAISRTQTGIKLVYRIFILAWFCFLFILHKINPVPRDVPAGFFVVFCVLAASAIGSGFVMRRKFFKLMAEALPNDPRQASQFWRSANLVSLGCALNPSIYGVVLKIVGSGWLVPGIFFALSLGFLLLWRPRQLAASSVQPA
jgi:hypothetical protein